MLESINTVLFAYLEGAIAKLVKIKPKITVKRNIGYGDKKGKFVDILQNSNPVNIDVEKEEEISKHKNRAEVLHSMDGYTQDTDLQENREKDNSEDDVVVLEDDY